MVVMINFKNMDGDTIAQQKKDNHVYNYLWFI